METLLTGQTKVANVTCLVYWT